MFLFQTFNKTLTGLLKKRVYSGGFALKVCFLTGVQMRCRRIRPCLTPRRFRVTSVLMRPHLRPSVLLDLLCWAAEREPGEMAKMETQPQTGVWIKAILQQLTFFRLLNLFSLFKTVECSLLSLSHIDSWQSEPGVCLFDFCQSTNEENAILLEYLLSPKK